jgi:protein-S-isoprenylcysteine O-methyltransferase Ste14
LVSQQPRKGMTAIDFTRWFLALFFVSVAAFYTIRIILLKRKMGISPVFAGQPGTLHFATHLAFRTFRIVILAVCVVRLLWPSLDRYLIPFNALWHPTILLLGDGLLLASFSAIILIHFYMGKEWRSGMRLGDRTELITTGPFAISQNPMMLCVVMGQVGFFLALPSAFTLICLLAGVWAVVTQVRVEQHLLRERFGATYDAYAACTPRWLIF